jgi:metal-responsive CopG/Arc/MetJ family transcriptional regulator
MAKVLLSLPDDLLGEIDARAKALSSTRSGYLRRLAEADLEDQTRRRAEVKRLIGLILADSGDEPWPDAAKMIREDRESR